MLLKEIIDNSIDEFIMGFGKKIDIAVEERHGLGARLRPRHSAGQSHRLRLHHQYRRQVQRRRVPVQRGAERRGHQGGERPVEPFPGGLVSRRRIFRGGVRSGANSNRKKRGPPRSRTAPMWSSCPTRRSSANTRSTMNTLKTRLWNYAYLNAGLKLYYDKQKIESKNGLLDLLQAEVGEKTVYPIGLFPGQADRMRLHPYRKLRRDLLLFRQWPVHRATAARTCPRSAKGSSRASTSFTRRTRTALTCAKASRAPSP